MNWNELPFRYRGSYMALSCIDGKFNLLNVQKGLYLRTAHGSADDPFIARITLANG